MTTEIKVPKLPESVADATLVKWHKKAGDAVSRDENLADLETDKVVLEVPAPVAGVLKEIRIQAGTTVTSDQVLAVVEAGAGRCGGAEGAAVAKEAAPVAKAAAPAAAPAAVPAAKSHRQRVAPGRRLGWMSVPLRAVGSVAQSPRVTCWRMLLAGPVASSVACR